MREIASIYKPTNNPPTVASVDNNNDQPSASLPAKPADSDSDPTQQSSVSHPQTAEKGVKRKKKGSKNKKKKNKKGVEASAGSKGLEGPERDVYD
jgi:hypothetical protein